MAEPGEDDGLQPEMEGRHSAHAENVATVVALVWLATVASLFAVFGGNVSLVGLLAISPFLAAVSARPRRVALVGAVAALCALFIHTAPHSYGGLNHTLRVVTQLAATALAMWIAYLRQQRSVQLRSARTATREERRRRVAAETTQRMQTMARALATAAEPAQVADAVFEALRDELQVDAATLAIVGEGSALRTLRRVGYGRQEPFGALLDALQPDSPLFKHHEALFAESRDDLRRQQAQADELLGGSGFQAVAAVPMVVSGHAIGILVVHWVRKRAISDPDRSFLVTIAGAAAQAVERARLTVTEYVNLERTHHLHRLSSALAAATTPEDVARAGANGARRALDARSAVVRVLGPGDRALASLATSGEVGVLPDGIVWLDTSTPGSAFTRGQTVVTTMDPQDSPQRESDAIGEPSGDAPFTIVDQPLIGSKGPIGVLSMALADQPEPDEPELRFLSTLAGLTAQALERAQAFAHEWQARRAAEAGRERLALLSEVTRLLSSSLDPTIVIDRTVALVERRLADSCTVEVPRENGLVRLDMPERAPVADGVVPFHSDAPAAVAYRTGHTQLLPLAVDAEASGVPTVLAVPMTANGEVIGVMTFRNGPGRLFEADDVSLAAELASRAGVALSNATRFQREHVMAEVLQRAVLPDRLPAAEVLEFDAEYRAGAAGTYVGGDWYDVFQLDDDSFFFSVGDVMGKGAPAAALMGQVRSAIRAYAVAGQSPAQVLSSLERLFDALVEDRVVTAVVGTVAPSTGRVVLSNAGHPSPLLVSDGRTAFCGQRCSLLIAAGLSRAERVEEELTLGCGDTLVMYSDGLIERRGELITDGMERLAEAATAIAGHGWPERSAVALASSLSNDEQDDDVVVLCINYRRARADASLGSRTGAARESRHGHFVGARPGAPVRISEPTVGTNRDGMATLHLEPVVESTPIARHWLAAHLENAPTEVVECACLLTSELVTNAVLHAVTPLSVTVHVLPGRLRIDVADGNPDVPAVKDYADDAATGRGLTLFDTLASDWGVQRVDGGKIVWFELPVDFPFAPKAVSDGTFRFDLPATASTEQRLETSAPAVVDLIGIPVALLQKASEEYEALFRELRLMREVSECGAELPDRLSDFVSQIGSRFDRLGAGMEDLWQQALDRELTHLDWVLHLARPAVAECEYYDAMLDEADEFARSARLISMPASPASVAVRRWLLSEIVGQLQGKAPIAWSESRFLAELPVSTPRREGSALMGRRWSPS